MTGVIVSNVLSVFRWIRKQPWKNLSPWLRKNPLIVKCTLDGLAVWMKKNPDAYIVTDVKGDNYKALRTILEMLPDAERRVIPQIIIRKVFRLLSSLVMSKLYGLSIVIWGLPSRYLIGLGNLTGRFPLQCRRTGEGQLCQWS